MAPADASFFSKVFGFGAFSLVGSFVSFVSMIGLAKAMPLEQFGLLTTCLAAAAMIEGLSSSQSWQVVLRYFPSGGAILDKSISVDIINLLVLALLTAAAALVFYNIGIDPLILALGCAAAAFRVIGSQRGVLRAVGRFSGLKLAIFSVSVSKAGALSIVMAYSAGVELVLLCFFCGEMVAFWFIYMDFRKVEVKKDSGSVRGWRRLAIITHLNASSVLVVRAIDELIIAAFLGLDEAGFYKVIKIVSGAIAKVIEPFYLLIFPELTNKISTKSFESVGRLLAQVTCFSGLGGVVFLTLVGVFGHTVLDLLDLAAESFELLFAYSMVVALNIVFFYAHPLAIATYNESRVLVLNIFSGTVYVFLLLVSVAPFGVLGAIVSFAFYTALTVGFRLYWSHRFFKESKFAKSVF